MIQRSGSSARSFLPMSAATARTCSTLVLSSVSGIVKNWGAWGSIAPPITVDIMVVLPVGAKISPKWANNKLTVAVPHQRVGPAGGGGRVGFTGRGDGRRPDLNPPPA